MAAVKRSAQPKLGEAAGSIQAEHQGQVQCLVSQPDLAPNMVTTCPAHGMAGLVMCVAVNHPKGKLISQKARTFSEKIGNTQLPMLFKGTFCGACGCRKGARIGHPAGSGAEREEPELCNTAARGSLLPKHRPPHRLHGGLFLPFRRCVYVCVQLPPVSSKNKYNTDAALRVTQAKIEGIPG